MCGVIVCERWYVTKLRVKCVCVCEVFVCERWYVTKLCVKFDKVTGGGGGGGGSGYRKANMPKQAGDAARQTCRQTKHEFGVQRVFCAFA